MREHKGVRRSETHSFVLFFPTECHPEEILRLGAFLNQHIGIGGLWERGEYQEREGEGGRGRCREREGEGGRGRCREREGEGGRGRCR